MKNIFCSILCLALPFLATAQQIVDTNLIAAIRWQCPECIDTSNKLTAHAQSIKSITLSNNITDLTGISGFSNLASLNVSDNKLTFLPPLPSNLTSFRCTNNLLTTLPTLSNRLTLLFCNGNKLTSLPNLPPQLQIFNCSNNKLTSLPTLPNTLESFYCSYNQLSGLPRLPNTLTDFGCASNNLTSLPDLPPNIILLSCFSNPLLKCLPKLPTALKYLEISGNISCLPNAVTGLTIYRYDITVFNTILLPVCSTINPNPCSTTTALADDLSEKIRVFPSITEGVLRIESDNLKINNVIIFNQIGQELISTDARQLDISHLQSGIYFVGIQVGDNRILKKIQKL